MSDSNTEFLQVAADVATSITTKYLRADLDTQLELRDNFDRALRNYNKTRLAILKKQVICTPKDVEAMQQLRQKLSQANTQQQFLDSLLGFVRFLTMRFL
jgi:hypothetical protein